MWIAAKFALSGILGPAWLAKLIGGAVLIVGVFTTYAVWKHKIYLKGWNDHVQAIAEERAEAISKQREVLRSVRDCRTRGLQYDQITNKCVNRL